MMVSNYKTLSLIGAKSGAIFSLKACCNHVKRVEVVILLPRLFFILLCLA